MFEKKLHLVCIGRDSLKITSNYPGVLKLVIFFRVFDECL